MNEEQISKSVYFMIAQEHASHIRMLEESGLQDKFKFTHLIVSPNTYVEIMNSPEFLSYYFMGDPLCIFPGIQMTVSPVIEGWKWVCDFG